MRLVSDWWCPDLLSGPGNYLRRSADVVAAINLFRPDRRGLAIQAGGHIGAVPMMLAAYYDETITLEAHPDNFEALMANKGLHQKERDGDIVALKAALGHKAGTAELWPHERISGQHRVRLDRPGDVAVLSIDKICEGRHLDALFLDIEGHELSALRGGLKTLDRCRPLIMVEHNKRCRDHGYAMDDLPKWLRSFSYAHTASIGEDQIWLPL